jgi:hypothetical protein
LHDFKQLSPADFEDLTRDLLQKHWNLQLESFKTGRDNGIDLRFSEIKNHSIVIQCKHFAGSTITHLVYKLRNEEYGKIVRLAPSRYVLVTSLPLSPGDKDKISAALFPYIRTTGDIVGAEDLNNLLGQHSEIETQHFKLWLSSTAVLQRVLHNAERVQTEFDVQRIRRRIPLYVQTTNYSRALKILNERKIVIISGVPGIGKTTLADMLLFAHLESGYQPVVIKSNIIEGKELFNDEIPQVFYFDDFLGETFLGNRFDFLGRKEDSAIINFMDLIMRSKRSRLILTTREHVLSHAYQISEHFRRQRDGIADHKCVLELNHYTLLDRGRILYNHIHFSDLPRGYKSELLKDGFYLQILKHRNFNPRLVEWLSQYIHVKALPSAGYRDEINRILENPEQLWRIAFEQQISEASRSLLLALYSLNGDVHLNRLNRPWQHLHEYRSKKYNWKTAPEDWRRSLQDLEGGFVNFAHGHISFVNPSVRDFLESTLICDTDHFEDLLSSACLFEQIVNVWSLIKSDKGKQLRASIAKSPSLLLKAVIHTQNNLHEESVQMGAGTVGTRELDVRPEIRLRTMLSIAEQANSVDALNAALDYTTTLITFWSNHIPNYREAVEILRALSRPGSAQKRKIDLYTMLKKSMLDELVETADSSDLFAVVDYVGDKNKYWTTNDREQLRKTIAEYLENGFDDEVSNYGSQDELSDLERRLEILGKWSGIDVGSYQTQIGEMIAAMEQSYDEDPDQIRDWKNSSDTVPQYIQEAEVIRLFDGFQNDFEATGSVGD